MTGAEVTAIVVAVVAPAAGFAGAWLGARASSSAVDRQIAHERIGTWRLDAAALLGELRRSTLLLNEANALGAAIAGGKHLGEVTLGLTSQLVPVAAEVGRLRALADLDSRQAQVLEGVAANLDELWSAWFSFAQTLLRDALVLAAPQPPGVTPMPSPTVDDDRHRLLAAIAEKDRLIAELERTIQAAGLPDTT